MTVYDEFDPARRDMLEAFIRLSDAARWAGVDADLITACHGQFFDGNVALRRWAGIAILLMHVWKPAARKAV